MDPQLRQAYQAARCYQSSKPFESSCYAPHTSLYFNTNGDVIACCKNTTYVLGNVATERLDDIWHGRRVKALRRALEKDRFGLGCEFCEWQIQGRAFEQCHAVTFDHLPVAAPDPEWPTRMEFTISNTCNLACVMCYGELSSTIRAHRDNLPPLPKVYDDRFFEDLRKYLPHLTHASFMGGEPFLAQENYRVWDMMIEDGIEIPLVVITNGTQWGPKVERILDAFPISISISHDGVTKETVESIRVNTRFEALRENTLRFRDYVRRKGTGMSLNYCLMRQNWHEFGEFLRYGEELDLQVFINTVVDPPDCSLYTLPSQELLDIVSEMEAQDARERFSRLPMNGSVWRSAVEALRNNANERQVEMLDDVKKAASQMRQRARPDHLSRAWELIGQERWNEALEEVSHIGETDTQAYDAATVAAHIQRGMGRLEDAEQSIERALSLWRKAPNAWVERAWLRIAQGRHEEAVGDGEKAQRLLTPANEERTAPAVYHVLSCAYGHVGRLQDALAYADKLVERRSEAPWFVHRAYVFERMRDGDAMLRDAEKALQLDGDNGEAARLVEVARGLLAGAE